MMIRLPTAAIAIILFIVGCGDGSAGSDFTTLCEKYCGLKGLCTRGAYIPDEVALCRGYCPKLAEQRILGAPPEDQAKYDLVDLNSTLVRCGQDAGTCDPEKETDAFSENCAESCSNFLQCLNGGGSSSGDLFGNDGPQQKRRR